MPDLAPSTDGHPEDAGAVFLLTSPTRTRLVLSGEVDVSLTVDLTEATREAERAGLVTEVDVRNVTFMDSSAMAMLARLAYQVPYRLQVIQPPDVVRFLLDVTAVMDLVDVLEDDPGFPHPAARENAASGASDAGRARVPVDEPSVGGGA